MIPELIRPHLVTLAKIAFILAGAYLTAAILGRIIRGIQSYFLKRIGDTEREKQAATLGSILSATTKVLVYVGAVIMSLRELGFDVVPLIAGASVAGLAVGFGAQSLVRDIIAGFFLLIENQIRVNDIAVINDIGGVVEEINLRTTVLRDIEGAVHVFPNGSITKLANRTNEFSYYVFNLFIAYGDDADKVAGIMRMVAAALSSEDLYRPFILAPLELFGVDQLGESSVNIKARIKTVPGKQWEVGREINRRLKIAFEQAGLEFPAKGPRRLEVLAPGTTRDELKLVIQEVIEEMHAERSRQAGN